MSLTRERNSQGGRDHAIRNQTFIILRQQKPDNDPKLHLYLLFYHQWKGCSTMYDWPTLTFEAFLLSSKST